MSDIPNTVHVLTPAAYVQIPVAAAMTGYTEKAIRRKINDGKWLEGREYIKAPDGHILISMKGYAQWAERGSDERTGRVAAMPLRAEPVRGVKPRARAQLEQQSVGSANDAQDPAAAHR